MSIHEVRHISIQGCGGVSTPTAPVTDFAWSSSRLSVVNLMAAAPASAQGLLLVVSNIEATRQELAAQCEPAENWPVRAYMPFI
jgi:hypothetical protein